MHFKWNYESPTPEQQKAAEELGAKLNMSPVLAHLLIKREITTESAAKRFFRPQLSDLINPFLMKDMDIAVDRLNDAMGRKERILVYGDYDVDGCTAVAWCTNSCSNSIQTSTTTFPTATTKVTE
mgnify:CR=1 FL=1